MWKRKKAKKKDAKDETLREPDMGTRSADDAPTQPARQSDRGDATVRQGQPATGEASERPEPNSAPGDAPHPAEADAPTVAIRPEFVRKLPDAPSVAGEPTGSSDHAGDADQEETVQLGRRRSPDSTQPPSTSDNPHSTPSEPETRPFDEDPTVPMGRRRN